jgi:hypothetical protein
VKFSNLRENIIPTSWRHRWEDLSRRPVKVRKPISKNKLGGDMPALGPQQPVLPSASQSWHYPSAGECAAITLLPQYLEGHVQGYFPSWAAALQVSEVHLSNTSACMPNYACYVKYDLLGLVLLGFHQSLRRMNLD